MNTFVSYSGKSTALRGFDRAFKNFTGDPEKFLDKVDGKWGFYKTSDGAPVQTNLAPVIEAPVEAPPAPDAFSKFAIAQLTGTAVPPVVAPAPVVPVVKTERTEIQKNRTENNGVKRPSVGTICWNVWEIASGLSNEGNESKTPSLDKVVKAAEAVGINKFTARTQYARWRVFHGLIGRISNKE